jgi:hypothetical protein
MTRSFRRSGLVSALALVGVSAIGRAQGPSAPAAMGAPPPGVAAPAAPAPLPATVKITIIAAPVQKRVAVFWGKRRLGLIAPHAPLILQRPRDSGPLDLIIQCEGFVPVQTRAYTFGDTKLIVKLTPLDQKNTLLGYREEVPPPAPPPTGGDGGVPAAPPTAAPPPGVAAPGAPPSGGGAPPPGVAAPPPGVAAPPAARAPQPAARPDAGAR